MKVNKLVAALALASVGVSVQAQEIVKTDAYVWRGDSIIQGEYVAHAPSSTEIVSSYYAQPHYFMPVEHVWKLKNDISMYPRLTTSNTLHAAVFNMGLDEMVNAVEPDTTLRTGKEWAGVWTRDVSYSIILSMAYMQPEASKISLMKKVNANGRIIQDTGSGGAWPVSSDRMIWAVAAYEVYKVTGDKEWLKFIYPVICDSFEDDFKVVYNAESGLVRGETSFIDWREQSYPKWMQTADIYNSEAMNTSVVHAEGLRILSKIADELGKKKEAKRYAEAAKSLTDAINRVFWMDDKGYYAMYTYGRENMILNPRAETLGESLAILFNVASPERAKIISQSNPTTPYGVAIFYPQISDMPSYHNNALWPFVASYWTLACAKAGNEQATLQGFGSVFRPAALFATNKENFNLDNGDIATELNSSNMLWSLSGNIALTCRILFGINYEDNGLSFSPFVPKVMADNRTLSNFTYRDAKLNITVKGHGQHIKSFMLNGKECKPFIPADIKGVNEIVIEMDCEEIPAQAVNNQPNLKAPLTPIAWIEDGRLCWNPIEYIGHYEVILNGKRVAKTRQTSYALTEQGEWQVIGVSEAGVESFASEPRSNADRFVVEMPGEKTSMKSAEISYQPLTSIAGYNGKGFVETDHSTAAISVTIDVPADGEYAFSLRYANGNGPVNTENKCAIRTLTVDGNKIGTVVMPHRGVANWDDWGMTNEVKTELKAGKHTLCIEYRPENENMNLSTNHAIIDCVKLVRVK
ncbi:MAG: trehalase family glycosidase [Muribaculaceae bacterium]|nr:trehalase family glycosidase [Muribaculaceae bacterium]